MLTGTINDKTTNILLDTGSSCSLIKENLLNGDVNLYKYPGIILDANKRPIDVLGRTFIDVKTENGSLNNIEILVLKKKNNLPIDCLFGMNILKHSTLDFAQQTISFNIPEGNKMNKQGMTITLLSNKIISKSKLESFTLIKEKKKVTFSDVVKQLTYVKDKYWKKYRYNKYRYDYIKRKENNNPEKRRIDSDEKIIEVNEPLNEYDNSNEVNVTIGTNLINEPIMKTVNETESILNEPECITDSIIHLKEDLLIESNMNIITDLKLNKNVNLEGCNVIIMKNELRPGVIVGASVSKVTDNKVKVTMINSTEEEVLLKRGTMISKCNVLNEMEQVFHISENEKTTQYEPLKLEDINSDNEEIKDDLLKLLNNYRQTCYKNNDESIGCARNVEPFDIKLNTDKPIFRRQYKIPHCHEAEVEKQVNEMLQNKVIEPSTSPYNFPIIVVPKKDGKKRICVDFRELNKITEDIKYPLPVISDIINSLNNQKIFSSIDMVNAYHQIEITKEASKFTAFSTKSNHYQFTRLPFGLKNAPIFFSKVINSVLYDLLGDGILCYLDDIIVFSKTEEEHLQKLNSLLQRLQRANLKIKISKCKFFANKLKFLGFQISEKGLSVDPEKQETILKLKNPTTKSELQSFLGSFNFYRNFIRQFASISQPLYSLLKKKAIFEWKDKHSEAVTKLKSCLTKPPILKFPDFTKAFYLATDSSTTGLGAVLLQEHNDILFPISYISKSLTKTQSNYAASKLEMLAVVHALQHYRHIILNYDVTLFTDHKPLISMFNNQNSPGCLGRWSILCSEYNLKIKYLPGKLNHFADTLSRLSDVNSQSELLVEDIENNLTENLYNINSIQIEDHPKMNCSLPCDINELKSEQRKDEYCNLIRKSILSKKFARDNHDRIPKNLYQFKLINNIIFFNRTIKRANLNYNYVVPYIPDSLITKTMDMCHNHLLAGHIGAERTFNLFKVNFFNKNEKQLIKDFAEKCELCITAKSRPKKVPLKTYPIPHQPFTTVAIDLLGPLISSNGIHK